uniref:Dystrophin n=1 Tax=Syphacia muris TaxID=451379 RepID=A0A0N5AAW5_9BILA
MESWVNNLNIECCKALLSDLQHTTEVLKRANLNDRPAEVADIEPVYQEQTRRSPSRHGLDSLEHMLDSYTEKRREYDDEAGSTPSTIQKSRPTVQSLFNELEQNRQAFTFCFNTSLCEWTLYL